MESVAHRSIQYCVYGRTLLDEKPNLSDDDERKIMKTLLELFNQREWKIWHLRAFLSSQEIVIF